jgi:hypothetical protein
LANPPPYEDQSALEEYLANPPQDPVQHQLDLFLSDVVSVRSVSSLRNLLKLYTSIDASKLAAFNSGSTGTSTSSSSGGGANGEGAQAQEQTEEEVLQQLMALKAGSRTYAKQGEGSLLDGERIVTNNLDFTIDGVSRAPHCDSEALSPFDWFARSLVSCVPGKRQAGFILALAFSISTNISLSYSTISFISSNLMSCPHSATRETHHGTQPKSDSSIEPR